MVGCRAARSQTSGTARSARSHLIQCASGLHGDIEPRCTSGRLPESLLAMVIWIVDDFDVDAVETEPHDGGVDAVPCAIRAQAIRRSCTHREAVGVSSEGVLAGAWSHRFPEAVDSGRDPVRLARPVSQRRSDSPLWQSETVTTCGVERMDAAAPTPCRCRRRRLSSTAAKRLPKVAHSPREFGVPDSGLTELATGELRRGHGRGSQP